MIRRLCSKSAKSSGAKRSAVGGSLSILTGGLTRSRDYPEREGGRKGDTGVLLRRQVKGLPLLGIKLRLPDVDTDPDSCQRLEQRGGSKECLPPVQVKVCTWVLMECPPGVLRRSKYGISPDVLVGVRLKSASFNLSCLPRTLLFFPAPFRLLQGSN